MLYSCFGVDFGWILIGGGVQFSFVELVFDECILLDNYWYSLFDVQVVFKVMSDVFVCCIGKKVG